MAGNHYGLIIERQEFGVDRPQDLLRIAAGQIGPADAVHKQRVARDEFAFGWNPQADAALGVAGCLKNMELGRPQLHRIALARCHVDCGLFGCRYPQPSCLRVQVIVKLLIVGVHVDRRAGGRFQLLGAADMVDVGMSNDDSLYAQVVLGQSGQNDVDFIAWVDHHCFAALLVAEDGAIALQDADRQDFVNHTNLSFAQERLNKTVEIGISNIVVMHVVPFHRLFRTAGSQNHNGRWGG
jgi:hypothetical protein